MRLPANPLFTAESTRFTLRHCCEDCALFDPSSDACAHEWPSAEHRRAYYETQPQELVFCKEFELR